MLRHALLSLSAALLYAISQSPFGLSWAAFLVGAPLAMLVLDPGRPLRPAAAWMAGLLFGEAATLAVGGHWLFVGAHEFFGKPVAFSLGFTLLTTITHAGVFIGAAVALAAPMARLRSPSMRAVAFGAMWVAFELMRARLLYGCPWDFLGHALYRHPALLQVTALGGAYALSWLCVASGALAGQAIVVRGARAKVGLLAGALALPGAMWVFGALRLTAGGTEAPQAQLAVGLVQAGVGRHELWDPARRAHHLERLLELSRAPELAGVDLIVWPENAVPFLLDADVEARGRIVALARDSGAYVMAGAPRSESRGDGTAVFYNSVYLFPPDGSPYRTYDKVKLLPYIETTPAWVQALLPRANGIEYTPGGERALFDVEGWTIAPLICFESTYPEITRKIALHGADLLVNLSNDSWFDRGAAAEQHFGTTVLRTVETGLPLVRVANTGVSAVVSANGSIVVELPKRRAAVARYDLLRADRSTPVYARVGDAFAWACVALAAAVRFRVSRRYGRPGDPDRP